MWKRAVGRADCFSTLDDLVVVSSGVLQMINHHDDVSELYEIRSKMRPIHQEWTRAVLRTGKEVWVTILPSRPNCRLLVLESLPVF
jgi:hypothetical protein